MKTKNYHCHAMAAIAACLMIFFTTAFPFRALADDPPVKKFHADEIYLVSKDFLGNYQTTREFYTYDCGVLMTFLQQTLTAGIWTDTQLKEYTYDENGRLHTLFITPVGTRESLYTYAYESDGKMLTELFQRRNLGATNWDDYEIRTFTYNENDYLIQELKQRVVSGSWRNNLLTTNTYDQNGNMLTKLGQMWNNPTSAWRNVEFNSYTYDDDNRSLTRLCQIWLSNNWVNDSYGESTYDENGNLLTSLSQRWSGGQWVNNIMQYNDYDTGGNRLLSIIKNWLGGEWVNRWKIIYDYQPGFISGQTYYWVAATEEWVMGDNAPIELALVVDGNKTVFAMGMSYAHVYYSQELYVEPSTYQTVYLGYPPAECVEVSATVTGGTEPYTYLWDNGETGASFQACPTESTAYTVTVTDAEGCTFEASTRVCVIDVRCGNNMNKVLLCRYPPGNPDNPQTLCVALTAVPAHLALGSSLGACGTDHSCTDFKTTPVEAIHTEYSEDMFLQANPNPFETSTMISYRVNVPGKVTIRLVNSTGQQVRSLYEGYSVDGEMQHLEVSLRSLQPGMYICTLQQSDGSIATQKLVLRR